MLYQVVFVDDGSLPSGVEFAFVRDAAATYLFVKRSAVDPRTGRCDALSRAWEIWQAEGARSSFSRPRGFAVVG